MDVWPSFQVKSSVARPRHRGLCQAQGPYWYLQLVSAAGSIPAKVHRRMASFRLESASEALESDAEDCFGPHRRRAAAVSLPCPHRFSVSGPFSVPEGQCRLRRWCFTRSAGWDDLAGSEKVCEMVTWKLRSASCWWEVIQDVLGIAWNS